MRSEKWAKTAAEKDSNVKGGESDLEGKEPHNDPRLKRSLSNSKFSILFSSKGP